MRRQSSPLSLPQVSRATFGAGVVATLVKPAAATGGGLREERCMQWWARLRRVAQEERRGGQDWRGIFVCSADNLTTTGIYVGGLGKLA